ncbi:LOW QUALITY PROTEIN: membrane transporter, partial [Streptomyces sp. SPB78]
SSGARSRGWAWASCRSASRCSGTSYRPSGCPRRSRWSAPRWGSAAASACRSPRPSRSTRTGASCSGARRYSPPPSPRSCGPSCRTSRPVRAVSASTCPERSASARGFVCLLLGISKGADWGWGSATTLGLLGAAVVVLLLWGVWETRTKDPVVDLRTTARPRVLLTNAASIFTGFGMYASMLVLPQLLQFPEETGYGLGQSMLVAGLWMAPGGIMMMFVSPLGGKLSNARGPKFTLVGGVLVIAAGYGLSLLLMGSAWGVMVALMVINSGVGLAYGAMPALIMGAVPLSESAAANGFNALMRSLGTSIGAAVVGVVLAQLTTDFGGHALTSENGFRTGLLVGCGVALLAGLIAAAIPYRREAEGPRASGAVRVESREALA